MNKRKFLQGLLALAGLGAASGAKSAVSGRSSVLLQTSPLAGFQYHSGEALWPQLAVGQSLALTREADNPYDARAVRVDWQGQKLGYLPRLDNAAASQLMDRGERLEAAIAGLENSSNPWDRVRVEVRWRM